MRAELRFVGAVSCVKFEAELWCFKFRSWCVHSRGATSSGFSILQWSAFSCIFRLLCRSSLLSQMNFRKPSHVYPFDLLANELRSQLCSRQASYAVGCAVTSSVALRWAVQPAMKLGGGMDTDSVCAKPLPRGLKVSEDQCEVIFAWGGSRVRQLITAVCSA